MIVLLIALVISFIEGLRESAVYIIDRAGAFPRRDLSRKVKMYNALVFIVLVCIPLLMQYEGLIPSALLFIASLAIRWITLDGVLNVSRELPFFYVGTVAHTDVLSRHLFGNNAEAWTGFLKLAFIVLTILSYQLIT